MGLQLPPHVVRLLVVLFFIAAVLAQDDDGTIDNPDTFLNATLAAAYDQDPYLKYRPAFARSLPVQILLTGVVLTLVAVLLIHLIFTAQYHWPLAPVNYVLQLSGVSTLLISLVATLHVVLSATMNESQHWPYMLSYIAVNVPPSDSDTERNGWSLAEKATWFVMNASTSGLIQITHIQFLTLLYPSRIEGRLIFALLGPLAIVAAIMQLIPIGNDSKNLTSYASAVRNVCNATLSLLFTAALFIWGLCIKRKDAWRTDGGTAAFGCGALALALVSTALNFLYVPREEEYMWLPGLMWAVVLWQSFLGWWWWVGAGSELFLDEEELARIARRAEKRAARKQEARQRRLETKARAKVVLRGVAGAFGGGMRNRRPSDPDSNSPPPSPTHPPSTSSSTISSTTSVSPLPAYFPSIMHQWYTSLRRAHVDAARQQAVERVERIRELKGTDGPRSGWRLGSFAWRTDRRLPPDRRNMDDFDDDDVSEEIRQPPQPRGAGRPRSVWLWGPLGQWRLQDSTVY
ncbi:hypothetical protein MIND_00021400 [Mycena indigotica]|uniref:Uncharacterized protein n=1 Tax=Mycena indigotica TaxID=2126181 RepID=A0A8H6TE84_9AGAR|nr:uncharacterized protein MIND_00021400 [Mycena indigotica]KAF7315072.1 hypothetical protein MIND_00021400 [Mycena indigotica]